MNADKVDGVNNMAVANTTVALEPSKRELAKASKKAVGGDGRLRIQRRVVIDSDSENEVA